MIPPCPKCGAAPSKQWYGVYECGTCYTAWDQSHWCRIRELEQEVERMEADKTNKGAERKG